MSHMCRTRNTVERIYLLQIRENPMIMRAKSISTRIPVAVVVFIFESQAFHIPPLNRWKQLAKKQSDDLLNIFENHPNRNMLLKDFESSEEIHQFNQESKDLIPHMNNTEIFEFYETSSKRHCPDSALYWEIGIVFWFDILSIPGYVIKKNQLPDGQSLRETVYHDAREMLRTSQKCKEWSLPNFS